MAFLQIITDNILPLLIFVAIGYFMDKRFRLDVNAHADPTYFLHEGSLLFYFLQHLCGKD